MIFLNPGEVFFSPGDLHGQVVHTKTAKYCRITFDGHHFSSDAVSGIDDCFLDTANALAAKDGLGKTLSVTEFCRMLKYQFSSPECAVESLAGKLNLACNSVPYGQNDFGMFPPKEYADIESGKR